MWLKYAVSVFRLFLTRYFSISHFFLRYCGIGYPPMFPSLSQNFYVLPRAGKFLCIWLEWSACGQGIWRQILEKCQSPLHAQPHHTLPIRLKEKCGPFQLPRGWEHLATNGNVCLGEWGIWIWILTDTCKVCIN